MINLVNASTTGSKSLRLQFSVVAFSTTTEFELIFEVSILTFTISSAVDNLVSAIDGFGEDFLNFFLFLAEVAFDVFFAGILGLLILSLTEPE